MPARDNALSSIPEMDSAIDPVDPAMYDTCVVPTQVVSYDEAEASTIESAHLSTELFDSVQNRRHHKPNYRHIFTSIRLSRHVPSISSLMIVALSVRFMYAPYLTCQQQPESKFVGYQRSGSSKYQVDITIKVNPPPIVHCLLLTSARRPPNQHPSRLSPHP